MSDNLPTQHESAVAVLRKQVSDLDAQIQATARKLELETAQRDVLLDLEALVTRKPRARKVRAVTETPANDSARKIADLPEFEADPQSALGVRPSVFASPQIESGDTQEAA
jgi:hypothetical protein